MAATTMLSMGTHNTIHRPRSMVFYLNTVLVGGAGPTQGFQHNLHLHVTGAIPTTQYLCRLIPRTRVVNGACGLPVVALKQAGRVVIGTCAAVGGAGGFIHEPYTVEVRAFHSKFR